MENTPSTSLLYKSGTQKDDGTWSFDVLRHASELKNIHVKEDSDLAEIRALTVVCGATTIISLHLSLDEDAKIWELARELAHLALGHIRSNVGPPTSVHHLGSSHDVINKTEDDQLSGKLKQEVTDAWAAHLLVPRDSINRDWDFLKSDDDVEARESSVANSKRAASKQAATTGELYRPGSHEHLIAEWRRYRFWDFNPAPDVWLTQSFGLAHSETESRIASNTWSHAFAQTFELTERARDFWVQFCHSTRNDTVREHWKEGTGFIPFTLVSCKRHDKQPISLDGGISEVWEVILWHHQRRWSTIITRQSLYTLSISSASWDAQPRPEGYLPWIGQTYDTWEKLTLEGMNLSPLQISDIQSTVDSESSYEVPQAGGAGESHRVVMPETWEEAQPPNQSHPIVKSVNQHTMLSSAWALKPRTLDTSLRRPDHYTWHSQPSYSPVVGQALTGAYLSIHLSKNDVNGYIRACAEIEPLLHTPMSRQQYLHVAYVLALAHSAVGSYSSSAEWLDQALEDAVDLDDTGAMVDLLYLRGAINRAISHLREATDDYQDCVSILDHLSEHDPVDPVLMLDLQTQLAGFEFFLGRSEAVEDHLSRARSLIPFTSESVLAAANIEWIQAHLFRLTGQPERALRHALASADVYARYGGSASIVRIQTLVADVTLDLANAMPFGIDRRALSNLALSHQRIATQLANDSSDEAGQGLALLSYARYSQMVAKNEDRIATIERVARMAQHLNDDGLLAQSFTTLGNEFAASGNQQAATALYRQVLQLLDGSDMPVLAVFANRALLQAQEMD